jgi:antitoxin MazE
MTVQTAIAKWGNSLALRLPRNVATDLQLVEGSAVELHVEGVAIIVTPTRKKYKLDDLLAQYKPEHRRSELGWGEPVGEEVW